MKALNEELNHDLVCIEDNVNSAIEALDDARQGEPHAYREIETAFETISVYCHRALVTLIAQRALADALATKEPSNKNGA